MQTVSVLVALLALVPLSEAFLGGLFGGGGGHGGGRGGCACPVQRVCVAQRACPVQRCPVYYPQPQYQRPCPVYYPQPAPRCPPPVYPRPCPQPRRQYCPPPQPQRACPVYQAPRCPPPAPQRVCPQPRPQYCPQPQPQRCVQACPAPACPRPRCGRSAMNDNDVTATNQGTTGSLCNSDTLKTVMQQAMTSSASESKRSVKKMAEQRLFGKFDVICTEGSLSYVVSTNFFCQLTKENVTCYAFRA